MTSVEIKEIARVLLESVEATIQGTFNELERESKPREFAGTASFTAEFVPKCEHQFPVKITVSAARGEIDRVYWVSLRGAYYLGEYIRGVALSAGFQKP